MTDWVLGSGFTWTAYLYLVKTQKFCPLHCRGYYQFTTQTGLEKSAMMLLYVLEKNTDYFLKNFLIYENISSVTEKKMSFLPGKE